MNNNQTLNEGSASLLAYFVSKEFLMTVGSAGALASVITFLKGSSANVQKRFRKVAKMLVKMQKQFGGEAAGLDMKTVLPKTGILTSKIFKASDDDKGAIGIVPFVNRYIKEIAKDRQYLTGKTSNDSKDNVDVNGNTLDFDTAFNKATTDQAKAEVCYAMISSFCNKYFNMDVVKSRLSSKSTTNNNDRKAKDQYLVDTFEHIIKSMNNAQSQKDDHTISPFYSRVYKNYMNMVERYIKLCTTIVNNFKKYTKIDNEAKDKEQEKQANELAAAVAKFEEELAKQKDGYEANFYRVINTIISSEEYTNTIDAMINEVIPKYKKLIEHGASFGSDSSDSAEQPGDDKSKTSIIDTLKGEDADLYQKTGNNEQDFIFVLNNAESASKTTSFAPDEKLNEQGEKDSNDINSQNNNQKPVQIVVLKTDKTSNSVKAFLVNSGNQTKEQIEKEIEATSTFKQKDSKEKEEIINQYKNQLSDLTNAEQMSYDKFKNETLVNPEAPEGGNTGTGSEGEGKTPEERTKTPEDKNTETGSGGKDQEFNEDIKTEKWYTPLIDRLKSGWKNINEKFNNFFNYVFSEHRISEIDVVSNDGITALVGKMDDKNKTSGANKQEQSTTEKPSENSDDPSAGNTAAPASAATPATTPANPEQNKDEYVFILGWQENNTKDQEETHTAGKNIVRINTINSQEIKIETFNNDNDTLYEICKLPIIGDDPNSNIEWYVIKFEDNPEDWGICMHYRDIEKYVYCGTLKDCIAHNNNNNNLPIQIKQLNDFNNSKLTMPEEIKQLQGGYAEKLLPQSTNDSYNIEYSKQFNLAESFMGTLSYLKVTRNITIDSKDNYYVLSENAWGDGSLRNPVEYLKNKLDESSKFYSYSDFANYAKSSVSINFIPVSESSYKTSLPYNRYQMLTESNPLYESLVFVSFDNSDERKVKNIIKVQDIQKIVG